MLVICTPIISVSICIEIKEHTLLSVNVMTKTKMTAYTMGNVLNY